MTDPRNEPGRDCPFCAIANGEDADVHVICEGASWVAFFPPEPATVGHTLIIPRQHFPDLWDTPADIAQALMSAALAVGRAIRQSITPEGMNLITSSGTPAEQTVFHVHLHVVPRWSDDGFGRIWPDSPTIDEEGLRSVAALMRAACGRS